LITLCINNFTRNKMQVNLYSFIKKISRIRDDLRNKFNPLHKL